METAGLSPAQEEPPTAPTDGAWRQEWLSSVRELDRVLGVVVRAMADRGFPGQDIYAMRLALGEAIVNGIHHGHHDDASKQVQVRYRVEEDSARVEVTDQGTGFDAHAVADPLADDNRDRIGGHIGGRGLLLMRAHLTWLRFNRRGNSVVLCKYRSGRASAETAREE
jgi:anti-sigma regulatory factor (Ser/Thr protein kinase)